MPHPAPSSAVHDAGRLRALESYGILDTPPEEGFDDIVQLAAQLCGTSVALVSLVADGRQWFKARVGFPACQTDLDSSVCAHVLTAPDLLIIPDLTRDARTRANPLVVGAPHIRFYAGAPLHTPEGQVLGSLCVIDGGPRPDGLTAAQAGGLRALARQVMSQLEIRRAIAARDAALAEQETTIAQQNALIATQADVIAGGGDRDRILDALLAGAMRAVPQAEGGVIALRDAEALLCRAARGRLADRRGARVPLDHGLSGACFRGGEALRVDDARADARLEARADAAQGQGTDLCACVMAPVRHGADTVGVLELRAGRAGAFAEHDLRAVRLFAGMISAGLAQASEAEARRAGEVSEGRYRALFDSATDYAIILLDLEGRIVDWNAGAAGILGWSADDVMGRSADLIFTPEDRAAGVPARELRDAAREGRALDERWHLRRDATRFWASGELMRLHDAAGVHQGYVKFLRDRTAQHAASAALRTAEANLERAQVAGGIGLFTVGIADNVLHPSEEFCRLYGLPVRESYPADAFERLVVAEDRHRVSTAESRRNGEPPRDVEYRIRRPDTGEIRWIARRGEIERDGGGRPVRFSGVSRDITEQRLAVDALARSEERFRTILDTIEAAFAIVQVKFDADDRPVDYRFVEANPAFERESGVNLRGKWVTEFAPDLERFWFETYGRVAKTREPENFESYAAAFGRWFDVRAVPVGDPADRQIAIFFNDVTARRDAEERLRASEALARANVERVQLALAAGAIIGTWHWDLPTDRFTVDDAFARSFGLDPALGREGIPLARIVATVHPDDQAGLAAAIGEAVARGGAYAHQYRTRRTDGHYYWLEANGRVEHGPDGTPLSFPGVLIDVEERRAIEAERDRAIAALRALNETLEQRVAERTTELMQTEEKLRQSQKMEAVGQLTGGLAHDFNNLLAGISGALELMGTRIAQGRLAEVDRYMAAAQGAARRAAALTHRLLAFSRRQTLDPRPTDVNALVDGMIELVQRTVGPGIPVETAGAPDLWPALVDGSQLENALLNLCINARDAMPEGGRITIETANRWMDREAARAHDLPEGPYLSLRVTDTGTGMPPEVIARVFEPFFTTKPIGQGTGLGLSMIYGFAQQSGGQVRIASEVGRGTTVSLYLPRYEGDAPSDEGGTDRNPVAFAGTGETVLVVDDEPTVRMLLTDVLGDLGYAVIEASDSAGGLKVLRSDVRIDLLITDVGLPGGMNGRQMADAAREVRPRLKTLFVTGYAENAAVGNGQLAPGMQVMTKPFAVDTLAARIRDLMTAPVVGPAPGAPA